MYLHEFDQEALYKGSLVITIDNKEVYWDNASENWFFTERTNFGPVLPNAFVGRRLFNENWEEYKEPVTWHYEGLMNDQALFHTTKLKVKTFGIGDVLFVKGKKYKLVEVQEDD